MKWSREARSYLETLQKTEYLNRGLPLPNYSATKEERIKRQKRLLQEILDADQLLTPSQRKKELEVNVKAMEELERAKVPTKYENPLFYHLMMQMYDDIEKAAVQLDSDFDPNLSSHQNEKKYPPLLGTLPTGSMNAMAIQVPNKKDYLVVFENDLFAFCNLFSKVLAMSMPFKGVEQRPVKGSKAENHLTFSTDEKDIRENIANNRDILHRFQELLLGYLLDGSPSAAPQYLLKGTASYMAERARDAMELFVMGHEYSHIRLGHLLEPENGIRVADTALASGEVEEINYSWQSELEADLFGSLYSRGVLLKKGYDQANSYWGADLFFTCDDIILRTLAVLRTGKEPDNENVDPNSTHPPAKMRRGELRSFLVERSGKEFIALGEVGETIIETLWAETRPLLVDLHQEGVKVHPHFGDW